MNRQLRMGGGIMNLQPRQQYGLGSFVKSITKGAKKAVSGVVDAATDFAKSDLGKAALLAAGGYYLGGGNLFGLQRAGMSGFSFGNLPGASLFTAADGVNKAKTAKSFGDTMKVFAGGSLLGGLLNQAEQEGDPEGITRNVGALKLKLADAYRNQRTFADAEDEEAAIAKQVDLDTAEYNQDMNRTRYGLGSLVTGSGMFKPVSASMNAGDTPVMSGSAMGGMIAKLINSNPDILKKLRSSSSSGYNDFIDENFNGIDDRKEAAMGGRIGYALGTPEQNAFKAARLEGLPLNQNPAGVSELDLRDSGGFIPPVGVKEKADDIPAMLSNNEFVFTADAVRGMGDGDVNRGAQRLYDQMKMLEKGGRV
jgi:hypothetical protein